MSHFLSQLGFVIAFALIGSLLLLGCSEGEEAKSRPMNLLVITTDTLRADRLGFYGYPRQTSPFLDSLASKSIVFERAVSSSAVTPVSHASIFTGLYPYHHGLRSLHGGVGYSLSPNVPTLATLLNEVGYSTAGFVSAFPATRHYGLHQGFETFDEEFARDPSQPLMSVDGIVNTGKTQRSGHQTTEAFLSWMEKDAGTPFFGWVHYFDVHDPILKPPEEYLALFPPKSDKRADQMRAIYDSETRFVDDQIAKLVEHLERKGLRDNTVILVISDHGEGLGDHNWWGHAILYEEQIRLPWLLSIPGLSPGRIAETVRSVDVVPTLMDYMGVASTVEWDGWSARPLIEGVDEAPRITYSESINDLMGYQQFPYKDASIYAVSDGPFKLITWRESKEDRKLELFNLEQDPGEHVDLSDRDVETRNRLRESLENLGAIVDERPEISMDDATKERLKALGYIK